ncbi:MAG: CehA/McbA family metallohydrolase [Terriglobia bacterium]|jgi:hypothetical protein
MKNPRFLILFLGLSISPSVYASTLHIQVVDESGQPARGRLEVRGAGGKMYQPAEALRDLTAGTHGVQPEYLGSFIVHGDCQIELPPGRFLVIGEHGTEYRRVEKSVTVAADGVTNVTVSLHPWIRMGKMGWWSGDLHVHRPPADAQKAVLAEDLNFCPVITDWPHRKNYQFQTGDIWGADANAVIGIDARHFVTLRNAEDERGGGAWLFLQLPSPLQDLNKSADWWPPALSFLHQARDPRPPHGLFPWIDAEKPFWWEVPVIMALAPADSMEILCNQLTEYGIEASEAWGRPRERSFAGREGWVSYLLSLYYHYLNLGFHLPAAAGTASGVLPNPIGFNRVYVNFSGPFSEEKWFRALREGPSFVTNGPMLFFHVKPQGALRKVTVEAHSSEPLDRIEIVANGEVIQWYPLPPGTADFQAESTVDPQKYSWIAARCFLRGGDTLRLAHTSPVYLPGHYDCRSDAKYYVDWMDNLIHQTKENPKRFPSATEQEQDLDTYGQALAFYQQKLAQGCAAD